MNRPTLLLASLLAFLPASLRADEVALMQIRFGKEKVLRPVAIELFEGDAPAHAKNFKELARDGFYKGMAFHRAIPNMLVQVGDPKSKSKDRAEVGTGGPGYTLPAEIRRKHVRGSVAAARLPDKINPSRMSNGSQFYVALAPLPELNGQYTVFGNVIYGLETLDAISNKPVDSNDYPIERITIQSIKVLPREQLPPPPSAAPVEAKPKRKAWWKIFG
jgi:cyclophilin family peptidyl-prolyl cis-trans isomerase